MIKNLKMVPEKEYSEKNYLQKKTKKKKENFVKYVNL